MDVGDEMSTRDTEVATAATIDVDVAEAAAHVEADAVTLSDFWINKYKNEVRFASRVARR